MKLMRVGSLALLATVLRFTSCAKPPHEQRSQGIAAESKAFELAKVEFAKTGRKVSDYEVTVETDSSGDNWIVWFDRKGAYATPGGNHSVIVEKATGKVAFMPGR
jgi:uncharacterized protein YpmB